MYKLYVSNLVDDIKANPRDFYRYINSQKKDTQGESEMQQADELNGQFTDAFNKTSTAKSRSQIGWLLSWMTLLFRL